MAERTRAQTGSALVSVVIPAYNNERHLADAIESVLAQIYRPLEVIVVDDGSTDSSGEIAGGFRPSVRCVSQRHRGIGAAMNRGIEEGRGELLALLDADDLWLPDKLMRQVSLLQRQPELDYVITRLRFAIEPGLPLPPGFRPELLNGEHAAHTPSAILMRRRAFDAVGPFSTDYSVASDVDWFARAKDIPLKVELIPEALLLKRLHETNASYSTSPRNYRHELLRALRESIARERC